MINKKPEYRTFWNTESKRWVTNAGVFNERGQSMVVQGTGGDPVESTKDAVEKFRRENHGGE